MYPVTDDYKNEIAKNNPVTRITGTLTLKDGYSLQITNEMIAKAPTITNQCVNNSELKLGQAYQAQLNISIYSEINRYSIYGARINLIFGLKIADAWEEVPCGEYIVSECIRTSNDILQITALDVMDRFDIDYPGDVVYGTPYSILSFVANKCGVPLAQNENEISALPNGTIVFGLSENYRSSTWRDVIGDLAACLAGNALIDRTGKLYIQTFATVPTMTIPASSRSKEKISDYLVSYSSASCSKNKKLVAVGTDSGQDLSLDDNDFLQLGTEGATKAVLTNILNAVKDLEYTPSEISWYGDPALDLGDLIKATGGAAGSGTMIPVQKFKWTWRGIHQITSVGKNPNLGEAKSLEDKKIDGILQNTSQNEVTYHNFTSINALTFDSEREVSIAKIAFTAAQKTTVKIMHEFIFDMEADLSQNLSYELRYYLNGELLSYKPYEQIGGLQDASEGDTTKFSICRTFFYILSNIDPNTRITWEVRIITHGIESTTIDIEHAHITLEGQRLYGEDYFDGVIDITENIEAFAISGVSLVSLLEQVNVGLISNSDITASDTLSPYSLGIGFGLATIEEGTVAVVFEYNEDMVSFCGEGLYCGDDMDTSGMNLLSDEGGTT